MSWDLLIFASGTPKAVDAAGMASFEAGWTPSRFGSLAQIHAQITAALPQTEWTDDRWGQYHDADCSLEFNLGSEDPVTSFMIHARGFSIHAILHLIAVSGWVALDTTTATWMDNGNNPDVGDRALQTQLNVMVDLVTPQRSPSLWDRLLRWTGR